MQEAILNNGGVLAWHFLPDDGMLRHVRGVHVEAGATYSTTGPPILCRSGMHASIQAIDALTYAHGALICRVLMHGTMIRDTDKLCATHRTVLWMADARHTLHEFAIACAKGALHNEQMCGREPNPVLWWALEVKQAWLDGKATDAELYAASKETNILVKDSVHYVPWSTDSLNIASWSVAGEAVWAASWETSWSAAKASSTAAARSLAWYSSSNTSRAETREAQNAELEAMLFKLAPAGYAEAAR